MEITNLKENGVLLIIPEGRIDMTTASDFQTKAMELSAGEQKVALDFSKVNYISSAGLRSVLVLAKEMNKKKGDLQIYSMNDSIRDIFDMAGFSSIIKIVKTKEEVIN
jgi:anti-anti-sigma factor